MKSFQTVAAGLAMAMCGFLAAPALQAAGFPEKPIRIIVPYPAGSNTDNLARILGTGLAERTGQSVVIDNRSGAGGTIGVQGVVQAPPDGYTLLLHTNAIATEPVVKKNLPYDARRDLTPITTVVSAPNVLIVHPSLPVKNVAELIAYAKANPGKVNVGSSGSGTLVHLAAELFKAMAGINIVHVPYRGGAQSQPALWNNEVQMLIDPLPSSKSMAASGRVRALAVTSTERSDMWPELPTVSESGLPGYNAIVWFGLFAPAGTPPDVVAKISSDVRAVLASRQTRESLQKLNAVGVGDTPEVFAKKVSAEFASWEKVSREAGLKFD
ncbi:MAG: tripartite tricarboxylate transporter substrate binding protein [Burkholderiaceae bacterium]|nr:tripartite tricarboxylate transporter substrate binding protein [Burkholderiaceae bacterium]